MCVCGGGDPKCTAVRWVRLLCFLVDDWMSEKTLDVFQSDEVISMVASVLSSRHSALKLFLDRCVVTLGPDPAATPSCDLIDYHGSEPHPSHLLRNRNI